MKLLVCVLFAAVLVSSSDGQSCLDHAQCIPVYTDPTDLKKVCDELTRSMNCYDTVLPACKNISGLEATVSSLEDLIGKTRKNIATTCELSTSHGQSCLNGYRCAPDFTDPDDAKKVCAEVGRSLKCFEMVLADCKKVSGMDEITSGMDDLLEETKILYAEKCGCAAVHVSIFTLLAAFLVYMFL